MIFSKKTHEGEIFVDHRTSPGIPENYAIRLGYHPTQVAEGKVFEAATYSCSHCQRVVVINPLRIRERAYCIKCNRYICDICDGVRREADYVHYSIAEIVDKVQSGKFTVSGSMGKPIVKPIGE